MSEITASVIIASYNMRSMIGDCLDALLAQKTAYSYEIIVADSSNDGTAEWVAERYPTIMLLRLKERTFPGAARNAAIRIARGEVLAFTDCDCIVSPEWLNTIIEDQHADRPAVGGPVGNGTPWNPVGTAEYLLEFNSYLGRSARDVGVMPTCNISYRRDLFETFGLFPATIKGSDSVFSRKISGAGISILLDPAICMIHRNRTNLRGFFRNQYNLGIGSAQTRKIMPISGAWLLKFPLLALSIPFLRIVVISVRLLHWSPGNFLKFAALFWLTIPGLFVFSAGFIQGVRQPLPEM